MTWLSTHKWPFQGWKRDLHLQNHFTSGKSKHFWPDVFVEPGSFSIKSTGKSGEKIDQRRKRRVFQGKLGPRLFQENPGWWNIMILDRCNGTIYVVSSIFTNTWVFKEVFFFVLTNELDIENHPVVTLGKHLVFRNSSLLGYFKRTDRYTM